MKMPITAAANVRALAWFAATVMVSLAASVQLVRSPPAHELVAVAGTPTAALALAQKD